MLWNFKTLQVTFLSILLRHTEVVVAVFVCYLPSIQLEETYFWVGESLAMNKSTHSHCGVLIEGSHTWLMWQPLEKRITALEALVMLVL